MSRIPPVRAWRVRYWRDKVWLGEIVVQAINKDFARYQARQLAWGLTLAGQRPNRSTVSLVKGN